MTVREILTMGDARLLRVAQPVTEFDTPALHALVEDMFDTMRAANGAGLAAPQIGINLQVVIFATPTVPETVLLNPVLTPIGSEMEEAMEGCLSVPGMRGSVPRFKRLHYEGFDQYGKPIVRDVEDFHARVVQHEVDHLLGQLYPSRIRDFTKFGFTSVQQEG